MVFGFVSIGLGLVVSVVALRTNPQGVAAGLAVNGVSVLAGSGIIEIALAFVDIVRERHHVETSLVVTIVDPSPAPDGDIAATWRLTNTVTTELFFITLFSNVDLKLWWIDFGSDDDQGPRVKRPQAIENRTYIHIERLGPGETLHARVEYSPSPRETPQVVCSWSVAGEIERSKRNSWPKSARFSHQYYLPEASE